MSLFRLSPACVLFAAALSLAARADEGALSAQPAHWRASMEKIKLPGDESVGLAGLSYLVDVGAGFSVGPGAYGALTGHRGGLSVLGVEAAWRQPLVGRLGVEAGVFAGGGGGADAPVGGGLMWRPHVDLLWDLRGARVGVSYSQVRFPDGHFSSRQFGLVLQADTDFRFVEAAKLGGSSMPVASGRNGVGFDRVTVTTTALHTRKGAKRLDGRSLPTTIGMVGLRFDQSFGNAAYWGLEANGAVHGGVGGYAEYLATLGVEGSLSGDWLTLGARVAAGRAGGGTVDTGGGLLTKAAAYSTIRLSRDLGLTLEGGYQQAQHGFKAIAGTASLSWIIDDPTNLNAPSRVSRTEWSGGVERFSARVRGRSEHVEAAVLKVDRFLTPSIYLTGQAHSAFSGSAGGYTAGLFGFGARVPVGGRFHAGAELVAGAAGGGGMESFRGGVAQPSVFASVDITPALALRVGAGKLMSLKQSENRTVVDAALVFSFGLPTHGYR